MDREAIEQIRENKRKERQEKQVRKTLTLLTIAKKLVERKLVKQQVNFIVTWSFSTIRKA